MRLDDALQRADALFADCLATALLDCEATLKNHGVPLGTLPC
jgi:hypothetical protein